MGDAGRSSAIEYQKTVSVDGENYKFISLAPSKAFVMAMKLTKYIGEPIAAMAKTADKKPGKKGAKEEMDVGDALQGAVKTLLENLDEIALLNMIKELMLATEHDGKQVQFESHFQARLGHMMKVFAAAVEYQFSDFFSAIGQSIADVMGKVKA